MGVQWHLFKRAGIAVVGLGTLLSITGVAQEIQRSEVSVQGSGFFTKHSDGNGIRNEATKTGGVLAGYRYNITRWLAAEANYGYNRNSQLYFGTSPARIPTNIHQVTGSAVVKLPTFARFEPFARAGGGALIFDPRNNTSAFVAQTRETKGAFLYGGGADFSLAKHFVLRAEYRGFVYKAPSFNLASLDNNKWTHIAQPSAGVAFRF